MIVTAASLGVYAAAIALVPGVAAKAILCAPLLLAPLLWWLFSGSHRWLVLFFAAAWLLPPLPIAFGNSGPHVAVLPAAVGLWIGILRLSEWRLDTGAPSLAMLAMFSVLLASVALAGFYSGVDIATGSLARVLLFGIAGYVFFYLRSGPSPLTRRASQHLVRILFGIAVASALFACLDFYFQFPAPAGYGAQFVWLDTGVFRRAQGFFYEASTLGNFCAFFLDLVLVALFYRRRVRILPVWALLAGAAVLASALILSYSRASLLNVGISVLVLVWLNRGRIRHGRWIAGMVAFGAAGGAVIGWLLPGFVRLYWLRISASFQFLFDAPDAILSGRLRSWEVLQEFLLQHPWHALLGIGYKTLPYSDFIGGTAVADNTYLSMLVETGVLGLATLLILHVTILRGAHRAARSADPTRGLLGVWMLCFWCGQIVQMLSGDLLTYWRVLPVYFCVFALATREREAA